MFKLFTYLADWSVVKLGLDPASSLGNAVHFFIEDVTKIFVLIYALVFVVSLFRSQLSAGKVRMYLSGKNRWYGYFLAVFLGVVTPFCSCSSIPLFIGFIAAGIPFGITMAFLISSPLISEIAAFLLLGTAGVQVAAIYVLTGVVISVIGGWLCDKFHLERLIHFSVPAKPADRCCGCTDTRQKLGALVRDAHDYAWETLKSIGWYVLAGLAVGAFIHGYMPEAILVRWLGAENPLAVPLAALVGIPLYANHVGVIPIIQALLLKGVPVGTALVMLMSVTAISLPEMVMLKRVLSWKMIGLFTGFLLAAFVAVGYLLNWLM